MKYNKDVLKGMISATLEKEGMSLDSFESALSSGNPQEVSRHLRVVKEANWFSDIATGLKGGGMVLAGGYAAGGALAGMGAYKAYDTIKGTEEKLEEKKKEQKRIHDANLLLQRLRDNPQTA